MIERVAQGGDASGDAEEHARFGRALLKSRERSAECGRGLKETRSPVITYPLQVDLVGGGCRVPGSNPGPLSKSLYAAVAERPKALELRSDPGSGYTGSNPVCRTFQTPELNTNESTEGGGTGS
jgi:hypothetical protein